MLVKVYTANRSIYFTTLQNSRVASLDFVLAVFAEYLGFLRFFGPRCSVLLVATSD